MFQIPYGRQDVDDRDIEAVVRVMKGDWLTTGPEVQLFEEELATYLGVKGAVSVSSGTAALHSAYKAIGLGPGDEIITTPLTFIATASTAVQLGARVLFADVEPDTGNLDPEAVASLVGPRTRAIVAVDYAGHPANLQSLRVLADSTGVLLMEDAAHSLGSKLNEKHVGAYAHVAALSFFPTKNIATGEGGAVVSNDEEILDSVRTFSRQGLKREPRQLRIQDEGPWHQEVHELGLNYRLPDILCAIGRSQLARIESFKSRRANVFKRYGEWLDTECGMVLPACRSNVDPMWHLYPLRVPPPVRRYLFEWMRQHDVGVQVNYLPCYWHPYFEDRGYVRGTCPVAEEFYKGEISLPMYASLPIADQKHIVDLIHEVMK